MKKLLCLLLSISVFYAGCAGRQSNPIPAYLPGDENRSCQALQAEIAQLDADMQRILPETNKFGYNALCVAGGILVIVPFFFMDLKDADKIEWEAMRVRHNRLLVYAAEKNCDFGGKSSDKILSIEEVKKLTEEAKKQQESPNLLPYNQPKSQKDTQVSTGKENANGSSGPREEPQFIGVCAQCGRHIGKNEKICMLGSKILCPECFKKMSENH